MHGVELQKKTRSPRSLASLKTLRRSSQVSFFVPSSEAVTVKTCTLGNSRAQTLANPDNSGAQNSTNSHLCWELGRNRSLKLGVSLTTQALRTDDAKPLTPSGSKVERRPKACMCFRVLFKSRFFVKMSAGFSVPLTEKTLIEPACTSV